MADNDKTPDDAPEGFWEDFGKYCSTKLGLFEDFVKQQKTAPAPPAKDDDAPPANDAPKDDTPKPRTKRSWFGSE